MELYKSKLFQILLISFVSLTVVGMLPVFAVLTNDSPSWQDQVNYAALTVRAPTDCSGGLGGDSDHDGICDNWESNSGPNAGLHINFTDSTMGNTTVAYVYNLSCIPGNTIANDPTGLTVCPDPNKKDIYVELDWMTGQDPSPQAIADVVKAFDKQGIALHIQDGENPSTNSGDIGLHYCDVRMVTINGGTAGQACTNTNSPTNYQSYPFLKSARFGTVSERSGDPTACPSAINPTNTTTPNANAYNCLTAKRQVFHYGMLVNFQYGSVASSGWAEGIGNDFVVSLGNFQNGKGSIDEQEGAIMHELGHNFGLHHGGMIPPTGIEDDDNCKPNYLSVMSYTYELRETFDVCRPLDYSTTALSTLPESSLSDNSVGSYPYPSDNPPPPSGTTSTQPTSCPTSGQRPIIWSTSNGATITGTTGTSPIHWKTHAVPPYSLNLNKLGITGCNTGTLSTLSGFSDWNFIKNGTNGASPGTPALIFRQSSNFYQGTPQGEDQSADMGGPFTLESTPTGISSSGPPIITSPSDGTITLANSVTVSGTATTDDPVNVLVNNMPTATATVSGDQWSASVSLTSGTGNTIVAQQTQAGNTVSSSSITVVQNNGGGGGPDPLMIAISAAALAVAIAIGIVSIYRTR